jgi:ABC-type transport system involved in Fe-S cluster assembly fused permease/ATPase subunit
MNRAEAEANARATDGLLNYETVKYFGNEGARRVLRGSWLGLRGVGRGTRG